MDYKKQIFSSLLLVTFAVSISAQSNEARKVDEFGFIPCEETRARLDYFLSELQNNSQAKGFVLFYEGKYSRQVYDHFSNVKIETYLPTFGEAHHHAQTFINHFKFRSFPSDSYLFVSGGYRENYTVELWIVPNGVMSPKPAPTSDKMKYRKGKPLQIVCDQE